MLHTRPDIACRAICASHVSEQTFGKKKIKELNDSIKLINESPLLRLSFSPLERCTAHIRIYADASYPTNDDLSSQLNYFI